MKKCFDCMSEAVEKATKEHTYTFGDTVITVKCADWDKCTNCGQMVISWQASQKINKQVAMQLAQRGPVDGETFAFMRKAIEIQALDLAYLFGVTPSTVSRWENGRKPMDRVAWALLAELVRQDETEREETYRRLRTRPVTAPPTRASKRA